MNDAEKRYLTLLRMTGRFFFSFFTFLRETVISRLGNEICVVAQPWKSHCPTVISCMSINSLYIHFLKTANLANKQPFEEVKAIIILCFSHCRIVFSRPTYKWGGNIWIIYYILLNIRLIYKHVQLFQKKKRVIFPNYWSELFFVHFKKVEGMSE